MPEHAPSADPPAPQHAIGEAIRTVTAARLGRGFVPLAALAATGLVQLATGGLGNSQGWVLVFGAVATAVAMLAFGVRNVQKAFGRRDTVWMSLAVMGSIIPPVFTLYVFAWRGLREVAVGDGAMTRLLGVLFSGLGLWALRSWMRLVEVQSLARAMNLETDLDDREVL